MKNRRHATRIALVALLLACSIAMPLGQRATAPPTFAARLSVVPLDLSMRDVIAGEGTVTATLDGRVLTIKGTFKGLKSAATVARVHRSPTRGIRGPSIGDLQIDAATTGTIGGSLTLTAEQTEDLRRGLLYVQVHSEKAPDGNLWGWMGEAKQDK